MQSFKAWIKQYKGANSPFGDLANDIAIDKDFPNSNNYKILCDYLDNTIALKTLKKAWKYYKKQIDTKIAHSKLATRLEFARLLLISIQCNPEINDLLHGKESSGLEKISQDLLIIKSNMEDIMCKENPEWANIDIYYSNSKYFHDLNKKILVELDNVANDKATNLKTK